MGVKDDLKKLKGTIEGWTSTEDGYKRLIAAVLFVVGYFGILGQLGKRLEAARELRDSLKDTATWVDEIREIESALPVFEPLMFASRDPNDWDSYLLKFVEDAGVEFKGSGSREDKQIKDYVFLTREINVAGEFSSLVDLIDRIERGPRYVRVEEVSMRAQQNGGLHLRITIKCFAGETTRLREQRAMAGGENAELATPEPGPSNAATDPSIGGA